MISTDLFPASRTRAGGIIEFLLWSGARAAGLVDDEPTSPRRCSTPVSVNQFLLVKNLLVLNYDNSAETLVFDVGSEGPPRLMYRINPAENEMNFPSLAVIGEDSNLLVMSGKEGHVALFDLASGSIVQEFDIEPEHADDEEEEEFDLVFFFPLGKTGAAFIPVVFGGAANFWVYRLVERRLNLTKKHVLPERYKLVCVSEDHFVTLVSNITDSSALSELDEEERWALNPDEDGRTYDWVAVRSLDTGAILRNIRFGGEVVDVSFAVRWPILTFVTAAS